MVRSSTALKLSQTGRIAFRRAYADEAPKPKPGKLRRTFRWAWRLTYLSVLGVLGYTGYTIYLDRNPAEQLERDPSKKTLVILGESQTTRNQAMNQIH
jgi:NADH:ubiquinone reductase (non-electrogenic)